MQSGKQNEIDILSALTGKKHCDLEDNWKRHIKKMFPEVKSNDVVHAYFYHDGHAKPDLVVTVNDRSIRLSIKSGKNPSCHLENYSDFASFLTSIGVSDRILKIIYFYQFGRTEKLSNNGEPFTREELQTKYERYIKEANEYFLAHPGMVKKIIYRSLIRGVRYRAEPIDYFYYGNVFRGFLLSYDEINKVILEDPFVDCKAIHFYSLVFQPDGRNVNKSNHLFIRIKWPILSLRFYDEEFVEKYS